MMTLREREKNERVEALLRLTRRLCAPDLTLPESKAIRRELYAVLGRGDAGEMPATSTVGGAPFRAARKDRGRELCPTC